LEGPRSAQEGPSPTLSGRPGDQTGPSLFKAERRTLNKMRACLRFAPEGSGGRRNRLFAYDAYLAILSEGAEPL